MLKMSSICLPSILVQILGMHGPAEIGNSDLPIIAEQDVLGLNVPVNHIL